MPSEEGQMEFRLDDVSGIVATLRGAIKDIEGGNHASGAQRIMVASRHVQQSVRNHCSDVMRATGVQKRPLRDGDA